MQCCVFLSCVPFDLREILTTSSPDINFNVEPFNKVTSPIKRLHVTGFFIAYPKIKKLILGYTKCSVLCYHGCPQKYQKGDNVDILLILFRFLMMQSKWMFTKRS